MTKADYRWTKLEPRRDGAVFWRLLRNGTVVGDGRTKELARAAAASFIRSVRRIKP